MIAVGIFALIALALWGRDLWEHRRLGEELVERQQQPVIEPQGGALVHFIDQRDGTLVIETEGGVELEIRDRGLGLDDALDYLEWVETL